MIEITVTCDKCGAKETFEPRLMSGTSQEGADIICLSEPREVSVLENVRRNVIHKAGFDNWQQMNFSNGTVIVCDKCYKEYLKNIADLKEECDKRDKEALRASKVLDASKREWVSSFITKTKTYY